MNNHQDTPQPLLPDNLRRRLIKGGISAPVVLATLSSKSVLGAAPHNCTISGQLSGNVSTHVQGTCSLLGKSPAHYGATAPANWPNAANDFLNPTTSNPRTFRATPFTFPATTRFLDAYEREKISGGGTPPVGTISPATSWDVLIGSPVIVPSGALNYSWVLRARTGFFPNLALGSEALAAYMNAWDSANNPNYPLSPADVVNMFNAVVITSSPGYLVAPGVYWSAEDVLSYLQNLHA